MALPRPASVPRRRALVALAGATAFGALVAAACGDSAPRTGFDDASTEPPAEAAAPTPTSTATTPPRVDASPQPTGDSGEDDAGTCERTPPSNRCGLVTQCGCQPSETCDVFDFQEGGVGCVGFGTAPLGHPCTSTAGCAQGLSCVLGVCKPFCTTPGAACDGADAGTCQQIRFTDGTPVPNLTVCRARCELRTGLGCGGTTRAGTGTCVPDGDGGTDCTPGGTVAEKQLCSETRLCAPGLACVSLSVGGDECRRWCRVGTTDCGAGRTCSGFTQGKVYVDGVEHGVCP